VRKIVSHVIKNKHFQRDAAQSFFPFFSAHPVDFSFIGCMLYEDGKAAALL